MHKKIKILFVLSNLRPSNGVASFAMTYFRLLDKEKYQVDFSILYNYKSPYYDEIKKNGGSVFLLPSLKNPIKHFRACRKIILENQYQIVHDNLLISSLPMMIEAKKNNTPVRILQSHNTKLSSIRWKRIRNKLALPFLKMTANTYFACSKAAGISMFGHAHFTVIPNTISSDKFNYDSEKRALIREKYDCQNKKIIGTVARVTWQKNPFFAVDVIEKLVKKDPNVQYWWVGSGELDNQLKKYINEKRLNEYIRIFGSIDDVSPLYQAMDMLFLPSLFEGLPVTSIEAQAAGLPCVISSSVTKELVYTNLVDFVSLDAPISQWVDVIEKQLSRKLDRRKGFTSLINSSYYAPKAAEILDNKYNDLLVIGRK